jgi:hypothetical protein
MPRCLALSGVVMPISRSLSHSCSELLIHRAVVFAMFMLRPLIQQQKVACQCMREEILCITCCGRSHVLPNIITSLKKKERLTKLTPLFVLPNQRLLVCTE